MGVVSCSLILFYGHEINSLFLDVIHDCSLEQFITSPTRGSNTLDLTFSSQSIISDTSVYCSYLAECLTMKLSSSQVFTFFAG